MNNGNQFSVIEYPGGVLAVDSGYVRERMAACYLLEGENEVAVVETAPGGIVNRDMTMVVAPKR